MPPSQPLHDRFIAKIHLYVCTKANSLSLLNFIIIDLKSRLLHKDPKHPEVLLFNKIGEVIKYVKVRLDRVESLQP